MRTIFLFLVSSNLLVSAQNNSSNLDTATVIFVKKTSFNKAGESNSYYEWYGRLSMKDYYIKFCESTIDRPTFEKKLEDNELIKSARITYQIVEGNWDKCDDIEVQSRVGEYMILLKYHE